MTRLGIHVCVRIVTIYVSVYILWIYIYIYIYARMFFVYIHIHIHELNDYSYISLQYIYTIYTHINTHIFRGGVLVV